MHTEAEERVLTYASTRPGFPIVTAVFQTGLHAV